MSFQDLSRLCIHTITNKPWTIEEALLHYTAAGVPGITVWRQALEGRDPAATGRRIRKAGMQVVSLCRGGFFPSIHAADRRTAIQNNLQAIDEAVALGAPLLVLVCGAEPGQSLWQSRQQIKDGIHALLAKAESCQVRLAIEPLHPMYADTRSAINTLKQANDLCVSIDSPWVGVAVDVYHLWWDPDLQVEISRCGELGKLFAFHVSDWRVPTVDLLNDRGLMGEGCIPIQQIRSWVEQAGFSGFVEVEIFSERYWVMDQDQYLEQIKDAYLRTA